MNRDIVARGSLRGRKWLLGDLGVDVLFCSEFLIKVESSRHLENVLLAVVLRFSGFIEREKGAVGAGCLSDVEGRSVREWVVRYGLLVFALVPDEHQRLIIGICPGFLWDWIMVLCLLRPMMGQ